MRTGLFAFVVTSAFGIAAASAGDLNSAYLRGSGAYEVTPYARAPQPFYDPPPPPGTALVAPAPVMAGYAAEFGARYWFSSGKYAKNLYDDPRSSNSLVSRLTYADVTAHSFEAFGKVSLPSNLFVKGYAGISAPLNSGKLNDEDFPPGISPYSNTLSSQSGGGLSYASVDLGYNYVVNPSTSLQFFAGYGYIAERFNAYGCTQQATNPFVCAPAIGSSVLGITENAHWNIARIGLGIEFKPIDKLTVSAEAAWVPYAGLSSTDTHWLRLGSTAGSFFGPIPQSAANTGFQAEALISYQVWDCFAVGLGGRYWHLEARGSGDLEQTVVGATNTMSQPMDFTSDRYGVYLQGSYKFNL